MNEAEKTAWIDKESKIVSFHAIDNGKMIVETENLFWDFLFGLTNSGYRACEGGSFWHEKNDRTASDGNSVPVFGSLRQSTGTRTESAGTPYESNRYSMKGTIRYDSDHAVFEVTESTSGLAEVGTAWVFPEMQEGF